MKRLVLCVLPLAVLPACRSASPRLTPTLPAAPSALQPYLDQLRLLRHDADKARVRVAAKEPAGGLCSVAVRVRSAAFEKDAARFSLETLGVPRLRNHAADCRKLQPQVDLVIAGLGASAQPEEVSARVDAVLQTAEAYLGASGVRFDRPAAAPPGEVATPTEVVASSEEHVLGRQVTAWPQPLLSVDPWYRDPGGKVKYQGQIEMDAVVGSDGRLYRPRFKTSLSELQQAAVVRALPLWRFEPARRGPATVAARIAVLPVLYIY
ncbi:MAG TPA: hypothetical protein VEQ10_11550 [Vicinamibacteria bacterium]|nr:hypothetical protein [Vicinamibacteria bacterium]